MSDTPEATSTLEPPKPAPPAPAVESHELPDWARKQISDANSEAAKYRVQLKEAKDARKDLEDRIATLTTEKSELVSSSSATQSDFDRLVTAIKAEVPHEHIFSFAKTLQGGSEEELSAHAAELKGMFGINAGPSRAVDRSQGQHGESAEDSPANEFYKLIQAQLK